MLEVNKYFDGKVKSIGFENHGKMSVGVMDIGEYTFGTQAAEKMTVVKGALIVRLPNNTDWQTFTSGQSFHVDANASFDLKVKEATAYLCEYL